MILSRHSPRHILASASRALAARSLSTRANDTDHRVLSTSIHATGIHASRAISPRFHATGIHASRAISPRIHATGIHAIDHRVSQAYSISGSIDLDTVCLVSSGSGEFYFIFANSDTIHNCQKRFTQRSLCAVFSRYFIITRLVRVILISYQNNGKCKLEVGFGVNSAHERAENSDKNFALAAEVLPNRRSVARTRVMIKPSACRRLRVSLGIPANSDVNRVKECCRTFLVRTRKLVTARRSQVWKTEELTWKPCGQRCSIPLNSFQVSAADRYAV